MSKKIIIVDDDEDLIEIMCDRLKMRGMMVTPIGTADEALRVIEREKFDVMIIDYMLPGTDGLKAIKKIRKAQPGLGIILQTAYATVEKEKEALATGAKGVIEKPADLSLVQSLPRGPPLRPYRCHHIALISISAVVDQLY